MFFFALLTKVQMVVYITRVLYIEFIFVISRTNFTQMYSVMTDSI